VYHWKQDFTDVVLVECLPSVTPLPFVTFVVVEHMQKQLPVYHWEQDFTDVMLVKCLPSVTPLPFVTFVVVEGM